MMWRNKRIHKLYAFSLAAVFALTLAGCGGGGGGTAQTPDPPPMPTAQERCEDAGGRYNADGSCTSAADLAQEMIDAAQMAAAAAAAAAQAAYDALTDEMKAGDVPNATRAADALADAQAANTAAQAATTPEAAKAAQANAEAAKAQVDRFAGLVSDAHAAAVAAEEERRRLAEEAAREAAALADAQTAAAAAAGAANDALNAAKAAVDGAAGDQDYDPVHYALAVDELGKAKDAKQAADAANAKAQAADNSADAEMYQAQAEAEQAKAEAARAAAVGFAGAVADAKAAAGEEERRQAEERERERMEAQLTEDLATAVSAAMDANMAAAQASRDAAEAVGTLAATAGVTVQQGIAAQAASARAADAAAEARAAHAKAVMAQNDRDLAAAQAAQAEAESAQMAAEAALGEITTVITMLEENNRNDANEAQRVLDVAAAKSAAMQSYMDADADATKAEAAADKAEETAPGSPGAMAARAAADKARAAANAAKAAHDAIMDDMTKAQADAEAEKAATAAGDANSEYMTAKAENDSIQNSAEVVKERQRVRDIADAKEAAGDAVDAAEAAKNAADTAATEAEQAESDAMAAYMKAMAARTDSTTAKEEYDKAKAAATAARNAANAANTAYMAAKMAADGIMDDGTADAAKMARMTAETEQGKAETAKGTAEEQKGLAETAEEAAVMAAGVHVLRFFQAANGDHVVDLETTANVNEKAAHVLSVGAAIATAAGGTADERAGSGTTATAAWPGDTVDDPDTAGTDESSEGMLSITVSPLGTAIPFNLMAVEADPDATPPVTAVIQTARKIDDLGSFAGYEIWEDDGTAAAGTALHTGDGARAIVFTNKTQDKSPVEASDPVTARSVLDATTPAAGELSNVRSSGRTITGVTWTPSGEGAMTGTLSCPANTACSITLGDDGAVSAITGYTFTGSRAAKAAVAACDAACQATANSDYLVFGIWLDESDDGATDTFGAFASGGDVATGVSATITGTATYTGKAAGVKSTATATDFFSADATLTADFGTNTGADPDIYGKIHNIVAGGEAESGEIILHTATSTAGAAFSGTTRMGEGKTNNAGMTVYPFTGTWSGAFHSPAPADDTNTADVDESAVAPGAIAGTFGVTMPDDADTENVNERTSYVGAFGAHKQ